MYNCVGRKKSGGLRENGVEESEEAVQKRRERKEPGHLASLIASLR